MRLSIALLAALGVLFTMSAASVAAENGIGLVTGPKTGTYITIGRDMAAAVRETNGPRIDVKESGGSIDNIKRIASGENAALGIVQSDVLGFLSRSKNPDSVKIANSLRMVFPFYQEEVHVLARRSIRSFADLQGRRVVIGEEGSGNMLTAVNLFSMMDVTPKESIRLAPPEGVVAVLKDEADAVIFVGGKPVRLFKNLEELRNAKNERYTDMLSQVHFLPLNEPKMLEEYKPAEITPQDYNFVAESVPTIAVTAVLVAYDFSAAGKHYNKERCTQLRQIGDAIRGNLPALVKNGHPKWQEVKPDADVGIWKKDTCAWPAEIVKPKLDDSGLGGDLINIIKEGKGSK